MTKTKPTATIMVAGAKGGMVKVEDHRFEADDWPISFEVPTAEADDWFRFFSAECEKRNWPRNELGQMDAGENSGSITVSTATGGEVFAVVWERKRGRSIQLRARCGATSDLSAAQVREFLEQVSARCRVGATERIYRRNYLQYEGLPWLGELWLDNTLRLGPPSQQDELGLVNGARIIMVDSLVACAGPSDAISVFDRDLRELSAFLSVVIGSNIRMPEFARVWTVTPSGTGCEVRQLGYLETEHFAEMPARGAARSVPLMPVTRPDFSRRGIRLGADVEKSPPADILDLWVAYRGLKPEQRRQFLQAAAKWQEALAHFRDRRTLSVALMVVACEALKPPGRKFDGHNIYGVVEALLGKDVAERLRKELFDPKLHPKTHPQGIRSTHLHRGEFHAAEFVQAMMMQRFIDPTFDAASRELAPVTQAAIIEWLRRGGVFTMLAPPQRTRRRGASKKKPGRQGSPRYRR